MACGVVKHKNSAKSNSKRMDLCTTRERSISMYLGDILRLKWSKREGLHLQDQGWVGRDDRWETTICAVHISNYRNVNWARWRGGLPGAVGIVTTDLSVMCTKFYVKKRTYGEMISLAFSPRDICGTPSSQPIYHQHHPQSSALETQLLYLPLMTLPTPILVTNGSPLSTEESNLWDY